MGNVIAPVVGLVVAGPVGAVAAVAGHAVVQSHARHDSPPPAPAAPPPPRPLTLEETKAAGRTHLGMKPEHFNVAVCGPAGVGKSTFVNAVCGLRPGDAGAAAVGITEATQDVRPYDLPGLPHVKLWDAPGFGTERHPTHSYVHDKCLVAFDALVVLYDNRLLAGVVDIVKAMNDAGVPVVLVRTKADAAVADLVTDRGLSHDAAVVAMRHEVEADVRGNLGDLTSSVQLRIVSMRQFRDGVSAFDEEAVVAFLRR